LGGKRILLKLIGLDVSIHRIFISMVGWEGCGTIIYDEFNVTVVIMVKPKCQG